MPAARTASTSASAARTPAVATVRLSYARKRVLVTKPASLAQARDLAVRCFELPETSRSTISFLFNQDGQDTLIWDDGAWDAVPRSSLVNVRLSDVEPDPTTRAPTPRSGASLSPANSDDEARRRFQSAATPEAARPAPARAARSDEASPEAPVVGLFGRPRAPSVERQARAPLRPPAAAGNSPLFPNVATTPTASTSAHLTTPNQGQAGVHSSTNRPSDSASVTSPTGSGTRDRGQEIMIRACSSTNRVTDFTTRTHKPFRKLREAIARVEHLPADCIVVTYQNQPCCDFMVPNFYSIMDGDIVDYRIETPVKAEEEEEKPNI